jgi:glyoxylase-like metal-dependent hydrolase (beta-lactamase superfamily II)
VPPPDPWDPDPVPGHVFRAGETLPIGVQAFDGREPNDPVLWIESHRALVVGDTLMDRGQGLVFPSFKVENADEIFAGLQPLRELPVEHLLPTHGQPGDRATLERALA